jgi:probable rRNA maturation factor
VTKAAIEPSVVVTCRNSGRKVEPRTLQRRCTRLLRYLGRADARVSVLLCDDAFIQDLNSAYRHKNQPTDVLSFSMSEGETLAGDPSLLGDIVISVETAERQAPGIGHTTTEETTSLMIHGLLHLLGFEHNTAETEKEMQNLARRCESFILKKNHDKYETH